MSFDYSKFVGKGRRLLKKYGFTAQLQQITNAGSQFNPTQSMVVHNVTVLDLGNVVVGERQSENVALRERQFLMPSENNVTPVKGNVLIIKSENYEVVEVDTIAPRRC